MNTIYEKGLMDKIKMIKNMKDWRNSNIHTWNISDENDFSHLFRYFPKISNKPLILRWNTEHVTNMRGMFEGCKQDFILDFNTINVTDMSIDV